MPELQTQAQALQSRREQFVEAAGATTKFQRVAVWHMGLRRLEKPIVDKRLLIQVDPALTQKVIELMESVAPAMADAFNRHLVPVADNAFNQWPVLSGFSKSLLGLEFIVSPDGLSFTGAITNRAPYSLFIRSPLQVVRGLVWDPGAIAADRIAEDAAEAIG